jgi:hypothetical protein
MASKSEQKRKVEKLFSKEKVVTLEALKHTLDTDFSKTVFRYLKEIGYLSSYNNAGKFYTLLNIPRFNEDGLWHHQTAYFSRFGTLKSTICSIIDNSYAGFAHGELKQLLGCRVQNTLNDLIRNNLATRESINGLFVYVSSDPKKAADQISQREKKSRIGRRQGVSLELPLIIEILLELLRSSIWDTKTVSRNLQIRKVSVTEQQVKEVLRHYNLKKKL